MFLRTRWEAHCREHNIACPPSCHLKMHVVAMARCKGFLCHPTNLSAMASCKYFHVFSYTYACFKLQRLLCVAYSAAMGLKGSLRLDSPCTRIPTFPICCKVRCVAERAVPPWETED